ncbi:hypothetical protein ACVW00_002579 [Marmoricola sp. URHA0025 HA25]
MNTITVTPEVQAFLTKVRAQLADLDPEEQREILDGLEADLTDLVAEHGGEALGDPVAYARELRAAAGLAPEMGPSRRQVDLSAGVHSFLDDAHRRFDRLAGALPGDGSAVLASMQPAWWVLRGWIAVELTAYFFGEWSLQVVPGSNVPGAIVIIAAVVLSVQLGRGRLWPGERWRTGAGLRTLLLGLNVFAVLMVPVVLSGLGHTRTDGSGRSYELGFQQGARSIRDAAAHAGVTVNGRPVSNIFPYDGHGRPLVGVQLFDQDGQPINVAGKSEYLDDPNEDRPLVFYPWTNGSTQLLNVFPIPTRLQDSNKPSATAFTEAVPPAIRPFPMAQVPGVSLPGIKTGRQPTAVPPAS